MKRWTVQDAQARFSEMLNSCLAEGAQIRVGEAVLRVVKPIVRCVATHVDPASGVRDIELVSALHEHYGRPTCGLYLQVSCGGAALEGDAARAD